MWPGVSSNGVEGRIRKSMSRWIPSGIVPLFVVGLHHRLVLGGCLHLVALIAGGAGARWCLGL